MPMGRTTLSEQHRKGISHALQCARGFAALLVVYYHASTIAVPRLTAGGEQSADRFATLPVFGACGVDLFFVLSGYIIWTSTRHMPSTFVFYKRRIARIVPLYWVVTVITAITLVTMPSVFRTLRFSLPHVAASLAFVPWQNPAFSSTTSGALTPLVVAGWTLNFEIMFYLLFGLVVSCQHHRLRTLVLTYVGFAALVCLVRPWFPVLRFYDPFLIAEFLIGCLVAAVIEQKWICPPHITLVVLPVATIVFLLGDYASPAISRLFYSGLPAAMIVYGLATLEWEGRWPRLNLIERIGDASYSIYLTHIFALAMMRLMWRPVASGLAVTWLQLIFAFSVITTSVVIGFASFKFVERPLSRWTERLLGIRRHTPNSTGMDEVSVSGALALRSL